MKNTFGSNISITLFGESHSSALGIVIDGMAAGIDVDEEFIANQLTLRRPYGQISTPRVEKDNFQILSGVFNGKTTGTPIAIIIPNENIRSQDYGDMLTKARPSHADYTAFKRYNGFQDYRGGGHFSGRVTAPIVAAGAIAISALNKKGIKIGTHISSCGNISDKPFSNLKTDIDELNKKVFAVLDDTAGEEMKNAILKAKSEGDSVGGTLETVVTGVPAGVGEPWFDSVEGLLSHALFSIPAVKGVEFGAGFGIAEMTGSVANDELRVQDGKIVTKSNNNGGINGGITNGMPIVFRVAVKPTPTIAKKQDTVDFIEMENAELEGKGRHDPCIVQRARVVVDSITALVLCDILATRFGSDWLA